MYTCQPTVVLCELHARLGSRRCTLVRGEEALREPNHTQQCCMLGEHGFCVHQHA